MGEKAVSTAASRTRAWLRGLLAGPLAFAAACLLMSGAALWYPPGAAQIDNLIVPIVVFPLLWAAFFIYSLMDPRLGRAYAVIGIVCIVNTVAIAMHLL